MRLSKDHQGCPDGLEAMGLDNDDDDDLIMMMMTEPRFEDCVRIQFTL